MRGADLLLNEPGSVLLFQRKTVESIPDKTKNGRPHRSSMKKLHFSLNRADFEAAQLFHSIFLHTATFPDRNDCESFVESFHSCGSDFERFLL
jgi:hypothetical protein